MKDDAAATLQARAACLHVAVLTRREAEAPEQIIARAETYWAWVSQPMPADKRPKPSR